MNRVVARRTREDEDDDGQEVVAFEGLHELRASGRSKWGRRRTRLRSLPPRAWAKAPRGLHQVVDASGLVGEPRTVKKVVDLGVRVASLHDGHVVVELNGAGLFDDDGGGTAHLVQPLPEERCVADRRRKRDEAHQRRGQDQDFFPHSAAEWILEEVHLVKDHQTQRR